MVSLHNALLRLNDNLTLIRASRFVCIGIMTAVLSASGLCASAEDPANPVIARYDGGVVTLQKLEEFAREVPLPQRIPFAYRGGDWRRQMSGELAKSIALTSQAKTLGMHLDPGFLRAKDYFIMEYMAFLVIRDHLTNKIDLSLDAQKKEYETHKSDFWLSPTVTLRIIRTQSTDKISSAAAALAKGEDFAQVELQLSEVSPRYRGRVLGPYPSPDERTMIPPPAEVIDLAMKQDEGQTTGPVQVGDFRFLVKTEKKTPGRQQDLAEVAEQLEERLRAKESSVRVPALVDKLQQDLQVQVDEVMFAREKTHDNDILATVGAYRLLRKEYTDLNGRVRGPAQRISSLLPTPLKQFVFPYMIAEWAKVNHYMDRDETKRAIYYYDLQQLSSRIGLSIAEELTPPPSEEELRKIFRENIDSYRVGGKAEPRFEEFRDEIYSLQMQQRSQEDQHKVAQAVLSKIQFQPVTGAESINMTALEALVKGSDKIAGDARLIEIAPATIPSDAHGSTPYTEIGRAPSWRIAYATPSGTISEITVNGPAPLLQNRESFTSVPAYRRWESLWRFDTDSLKRHAIDQALGDFMAKYQDRTRIAATVAFSYSTDDPTSPTDCLITYSATPADTSIMDGVLMQYSAHNGDITKRRLGEPEGKCPTCPAPDLPASGITQSTEAATTMTTVSPNPTPVKQGEQ